MRRLSPNGLGFPIPGGFPGDSANGLAIHRGVFAKFHADNLILCPCYGMQLGVDGTIPSLWMRKKLLDAY